MKRLLLSLSIVALGACTSISGYDAESRFECTAPKGLSCVSVSQTYKVAEAGQLPGERGGTQPEGGDARGDTSRQEGPAKRVAEAYKERRAPSVQFTTPAPVTTAAAAAPGAATRLSPAAFNAPSTGTHLRTPERLLRIWLAPFQDADGDLHDQRYVYVTVTPGQWTLESSRAAIKQRYQAVRLAKPEAPAPTSSNGSEGTPPRGAPAAPAAPTALPTSGGAGLSSRGEER